MRARALQDTEAVLEQAAYTHILASSDEEDNAIEEIESLVAIQQTISSNRYLQPRNQNRYHEVLEGFIHEYTETAFLALFRMHKASFRQLVQILVNASGSAYWDHRQFSRGYSRPIHQQIAVALYMLGGGRGGTGERSRIALNIGHGTTWSYTWKIIDVLASLIPNYIQWPSAGSSAFRASSHRIFQ